MQALRMGLLRLRQKSARGGLLLALLPCFLLLAYCCLFFCARAPTGRILDTGAGAGAGGGGGGAGAGAGMEVGGAVGATEVGSGAGPLALMVWVRFDEGHPAAWTRRGTEMGESGALLSDQSAGTLPGPQPQ